MIDLTEIRSLTEFKRHTAEFVERLRRTGRPQVLTVNGRAEVVVQDAASYQRLLDLLDRAEAIAGIRRGLSDVKAGRTSEAGRVLDDLRRKRRATGQEGAGRTPGRRS